MSKRDKIGWATIASGIITIGFRDLTKMCLFAIVTLSLAVWFYVEDKNEQRSH